MSPSEACERLHRLLNNAPVLTSWPPNGLYFFLERGETWGHGDNTGIRRITRCGSHEKCGRLKARAKEHFSQNSNGSVVVRHVGSAIARCVGSVALCDHWGDAESRQCELCKALVLNARSYLKDNVDVVVMGVPDNWTRAEKIAIGILANCLACQRSDAWLGRYASNATVSSGNLWNHNGSHYTPTTCDIEWFFQACATIERAP